MFKSIIQYLSSLHWKELILSEAFQYIAIGLIMLLSADTIAYPVYEYLKSLSVAEFILHVEIVARSAIVLGLLLFAFSLFFLTYKRVIAYLSAHFKTKTNF
jgi:hypothetical protein